MVISHGLGRHSCHRIVSIHHTPTSVHHIIEQRCKFLIDNTWTSKRPSSHTANIQRLVTRILFQFQGCNCCQSTSQRMTSHNNIGFLSKHCNNRIAQTCLFQCSECRKKSRMNLWIFQLRCIRVLRRDGIEIGEPIVEIVAATERDDISLIYSIISSETLQVFRFYDLGDDKV